MLFKVSVALLFQVTCVGSSRGALLSIAAQLAVSPFKYASNSLRSGRRTTGMFSAAACRTYTGWVRDTFFKMNSKHSRV